MHRRTFHISRTDSLPEELEGIADAQTVARARQAGGCEQNAGAARTP